MSDEFTTLITSLPLFKGYTVNGAQRILDAGDIKVLPHGEVLFKEGDPPGSVLLVLKGKLQVYVERQGKDMILTDSPPSTILGELSVLCGIPRSASVRVIDDATVLEWSAAEFRGLLVKDVFLSERIFRSSLRTLIEKERALIDSLSQATSEQTASTKQ